MIFSEYKKYKRNNIEQLNNIKCFLEEQKIIDAADITRQIDSDINALNSEEIKIIVCGTFGSGKTTLINSLMGIDFLPTEQGENSSTVVYFNAVDDEHQDKDALIKLYLNYSKEILLKGSDTENYLKLFLEKQVSFSGGEKVEENENYKLLSRYFEQDDLQFIKQNGWDPARDVYFVKVWLNNAILNEGISLVDTPGTGSITEKHEELTISEIERSNAFIYLFDSSQFGTMSEFHFIRRIWNHRDKSIFLFNRADHLYRDKANPDNAERTIEKFMEELPEDFSNDQLPRMFPLSLRLKFGSLSQKQEIMNDLNANYKQKEISSEELSNYDTIIMEIEKLIQKLKKDKGTENSFYNIDPKNYINKFQLRIEESIKALKNFDDKTLIEKINKKKEEINRLLEHRESIKFEKDITEKRISSLKNDITVKYSEDFEKIENMYKDQIEPLTYKEVFEYKKLVEPLSKIRTLFSKSKKEIIVRIKNNIREYINDILPVQEANLPELVSVQDIMKQDVDNNPIFSRNISDEIKEFENKRAEYQNNFLEKEKELEKIIVETNKKGKNSNLKIELDSCEAKMSRLMKQISDLGKPPSARIIKNEQVYLKTKSPFWKSDEYATMIRESLDTTELDEWKKIHNRLTNEIKQAEEDKFKILDSENEKETWILEQNGKQAEIEKQLEEVRGQLIKIIAEINKKQDEKERADLEEQKNIIYNKVIVFIKDWYDNLIGDSKNPGILSEIYSRALDLAANSANRIIAEKIDAKSMLIVNWNEYIKSSNTERDKKIIELTALRKESIERFN